MDSVSMSKNYSYNAPTYFDFNPQNTSDETVEAYFEIDHERVSVSKACTCDPLSLDCECTCEIRKMNGEEPHADPVGDLKDDAEFNTPKSEIYADPFDDLKDDAEFKTPKSEIYAEKAIIVDPFDDLKDDAQSSTPKSVLYPEKIADFERKPGKLRKSLSTGGLATMTDENSQNIRLLSNLNLDVKVCSFKGNRTLSKERINQLAQPKHIQNNFVSTAEQVTKFYGTLHSESKKQDPAKQAKAPCRTNPQSPILETRHRHRSKPMLTSEEMEIQEIQEYKKLHMKALPLNPKIFQGPMKPIHVFKKPTTIVQAFHLTECNTRKTDQTQNQKNRLTRQNSQPMKACTGAIPKLPTPTRSAPFSFEARNKLMAKRHQEKINKILEEEKKARQFRANPTPKYLPGASIVKSSSLSSVKSTKSEDDSKDPPKAFKAKPPTVLYQKPFEPKKPERHLVEITKFCLNTEQRAKEREEYEKILHEKREHIVMEKLRREEESTKREKEEIAQLRKHLVHSAQPIRQYKEVKIESSGAVTVPISPNFRTAQRRHSHRKENEDGIF